MTTTEGVTTRSMDKQEIKKIMIPVVNYSREEKAELPSTLRNAMDTIRDAVIENKEKEKIQISHNNSNYEETLMFVISSLFILSLLFVAAYKYSFFRYIYLLFIFLTLISHHYSDEFISHCSLVLQYQYLTARNFLHKLFQVK